MAVKRMSGLGMIGRLGKGRTPPAGPPTGQGANASQNVTPLQPKILPQMKGASSVRPAGSTDRVDSPSPPPLPQGGGTFQQNYGQSQQGQPADFTKALQDALGNIQGYKAGGLQGLFAGGGIKKANQRVSSEAEKLMEGGVTQQELESFLQSQQAREGKGWGVGYNKNVVAQLQQAIQSGGTPADTSGLAPSGGKNPFLTGEVTSTFGPQVGAIGEQLMTQAGQQLESEQAIRGRAGELYGDIQQTQQRAGGRIEGLQRQGEAQHQAFTEERKDLSQRIAELPGQVDQRFDSAINDFSAKVSQSQGIIDTKESAAMAQVMQGKNAAISAAVQGIQGNVNNAVAQIQSNPNLSDSQKQSMIAQTRLQGATQMAPAVGNTILQFNNLAAQTAVSFGNMTTQIQQTGLMGAADLMGKKASAFAETSIAAGQLGANLLSVQQTADSNYLSTQAQLESTRSTIEMSGDQLRAQLLPEMGIPYADYATPMTTDLQMNYDLSKTEFQALMGRQQYELMAWMSAQQAKGANGQMLAALAQGIGGPIGGILGFAGLFSGGQSSTPMPGLPGQMATPTGTPQTSWSMF